MKTAEKLLIWHLNNHRNLHLEVDNAYEGLLKMELYLFEGRLFQFSPCELSIYM
jgi:hypothetical protein